MKKGREKCFVKIKLKFEDYKHYLEATRPKNKINHLEKNILMWIILKNSQKTINWYWNLKKDLKVKKHNLFTEEIKKIKLSANDDKRIQ